MVSGLRPLRRLAAGLALAGAAALCGAQSLGSAFPLDMCAGDRFGSDLGCTAADVQITNIGITPGSSPPATCEGGSSITLDLDVTVQFNSTQRYDIGIFLSQDGASPKLRSTRTVTGGVGSASCKVAILPSPVLPGTTLTAARPFPNLDPGPYTIGGQSVSDTCGDGSKATVGGGTGSATFTIPGVTVQCKAANGGGALSIPFVVSWDNQNSPSGDVCTSAANPVPNTTSKCNAPSGTQSDVAVVTLPRITKTNLATSITPGDTTTYTITVANTTGIVVNNAVFKDPAVANLAVTGVTCAAQNASCPAAAATTVALMQGAGIVIPTLQVDGTVTFTVSALLAGNPSGNLTNVATLTANGATATASDVDAIVYPNLVNSKTATVLSDPINGTSNPMQIPGSETLYTITVSNPGAGRVDSNTIAIADPIPPNTALFVGNLGGSPAGPVSFTDNASNLSFSYVSLSSTADNVEFSSNGGASWTYVPTPDASGYDAAVTHIRVALDGRMAGWSGSGPYPGFTLAFKVRLN